MELNRRTIATSMLLAAAMLCPARQGLSAQAIGEGRPRVALNGSLGRHGLGVGFDVPVWDALGVAARAEAGMLARYAIAGAGLTVDLASGDEARAYALGLMGATHCGSRNGESRCHGGVSRAAVAALGGAEILLGEDGVWSAGVEAGYWLTMKRDAASRDLDHLAFSAMLRWRPR